MTAPKELLNITVLDTPLGNKWTLTLAGKTISGGYSKNLWAALDDVNEALASYVRTTILEGAE